MSSTERQVLAGLAPVPDPTTPGNILLRTSVQSFGNVCRASRYIFELRSANFDFVPIKAGPISYGLASQNALDPHPVFSGSRTGVTFEGPFLRYRVQRGVLNSRRPQMSVDVPQVTVLGNPNETDSDATFIFDLSCKRPILLPYAGSLEAFTQYPGRWEINAYRLEDARHAENDSPIEAELPLTLTLAPAAAGEIPVTTFREIGAPPPGAHSYTYRDKNSGTSGNIFEADHMLETSPKIDVGPGGVPLLTTIALLDPLGMSGQFYGRWGLGNIMRAKFNGCGQSQGQLSFHVSLH